MDSRGDANWVAKSAKIPNARSRAKADLVVVYSRVSDLALPETDSFNVWRLKKGDMGALDNQRFTPKTQALAYNRADNATASCGQPCSFHRLLHWTLFHRSG
jgi:hypothetical protein